MYSMGRIFDMRTLLIGGAAALFASACSSGLASSPQMDAMRIPAAVKVSPGFVQGGPAETILSQQFILHSEHAGRDYLIQVAFPIPGLPTATAKDVETMFPKRDAAAIYVLDGGTDFGLFAARRDVFTIGITQFGTTLQELYEARPRDFMHVRDPRLPKSGEGAKFAAFVTEELKPFIEARFPVNPQKAILAGQSLGGLFALHVLADTPDAFWGYLICTPSVGYDAVVVDKVREAALAGKGQRVFFGHDVPTPADKPFFDRTYAALTPLGGGLVVKRRAFPDEDHGSVGAVFASTSTRWITEELARPGAAEN
jgi:hypothetical protein